MAYCVLVAHSMVVLLIGTVWSYHRFYLLTRWVYYTDVNVFDCINRYFIIPMLLALSLRNTHYVLCSFLFAKKIVYGIMHVKSGRGPAWLGRYNGVVEVDGSNPSAPTKSGTIMDVWT